MEDKVREAFQEVLDKAQGGFADYAKAYARAGLLMTGEDLMYQVPYVLSNLQHWRGEDARRVKDVFKTYLKEVKKWV